MPAALFHTSSPLHLRTLGASLDEQCPPPVKLTVRGPPDFRIFADSPYQPPPTTPIFHRSLAPPSADGDPHELCQPWPVAGQLQVLVAELPQGAHQAGPVRLKGARAGGAGLVLLHGQGDAGREQGGVRETEADACAGSDVTLLRLVSECVLPGSLLQLRAERECNFARRRPVHFREAMCTRPPNPILPPDLGVQN